MVWLITFLTVSNIALGYGLAVYVQKQFGTMMPTCRLRSKKCEAPAVAEAVAEVAAVQSPPVSETNKVKTTKAPEAKPAANSTPPSASSAEEVNGLPPVDEENVLAGIEEFRSQLAKMNVPAEEGETDAPKQVEPEPVAAAN